jgi:hypothetical protein
LLHSSSVSAQPRQPASGKVRPSPTGGTVPEMPRLPSIRERQLKILEMEREAARARTPEEEKLALTEIAEDYEKIQVINNKMMGATMRAAVPDYARIAEVTSEIGRRANRMKENMRLPKALPNQNDEKASYKKPHDVSGMKANLLVLDASIMSFIKNPVFKNPDVLDVEQASKASRDLESVIELSNLINKDAQRLNKPTEKTQ